MPDSPISPVFFLVFGFVLAIVLQAWFVRRLSYLRGKTRESKEQCDRLHAEATSLAETVAEFSRGLDSNTTSVQMLEREIEELTTRIANLEGEPVDAENTSGAAATEPTGDASEPAEPDASRDGERPDVNGGEPAVPPAAPEGAPAPPEQTG